jgi:hypothetical protein
MTAGRSIGRPRAVAVAVAVGALLATGCQLAFGTPYPHVPKRVRHDDSWRLVNLETGESTPISIRGESGGGRRGVSLGVALGPGTTTLGDTASESSLAVHAGGEVHQLVTDDLGLAVEAGIHRDDATFTGSTRELSSFASPVGAKAVYAPRVPFVLHGGLAVDRHTVTVTDGDATLAEASGLGVHAYGGLGVACFYGGVGALVEGELRWRHAGTVELDGAAQTTRRPRSDGT